MNYLKEIVLSFSAISATTAHYQYHSPSYVPVKAECRHHTIPVTVTSENYQWTGQRWTDDYELTDFLTVASSRPSAGIPPPYGNLTEETESYKIGATFCTPKRGGTKAKTVLLATHGLTYDRRFSTIYPSS